MSAQVKTGETLNVDFVTSDPTTGAAADADSTPSGTLVVNGTDDGATVTVANKATGHYTASVTLPTLADGDDVQLLVAATVGGVAGKGIVWTGQGVTRRPGDDFTTTQKASVNAEVDTALSDYDAPTKAELDAGLAGLNDPTAAAIADAVWDEARSGHTTEGSYGEIFADIPSGDDLIDAIWDEARSGHTTEGSFGEVFGSLVSGDDVADAVLSRSVANVEDSAGVYSLCYLVLAATEASRSGSTLQVNKTDGSTSFATRTLTTSAVDPVTGVS